MNAIVETGVRVPSCAFLLIVVSRWVAKMTQCGRGAGDYAQSYPVRPGRRHSRVQLAGYDVYYQEANNETRRRSVTA